MHSFKGWNGKASKKTYKHNQITILEMRVEPVDREGEEHQYYRYGDSAVVELDMTCEYIFNRAGYDVVKPIQIKQSGMTDEQIF